MGKKTNELIPRESIKLYTKTLNKRTPIDKVIVFGSFARGDTRRDSDLDLIVLSKAFKKIGFLKRLEYLSKNWKDYDLPVDIIGYTPEEFFEGAKESAVLKEAARDGIVVYP